MRTGCSSYNYSFCQRKNLIKKKYQRHVCALIFWPPTIAGSEGKKTLTVDHKPIFCSFIFSSLFVPAIQRSPRVHTHQICSDIRLRLRAPSFSLVIAPRARRHNKNLPHKLRENSEKSAKAYPIASLLASHPSHPP